MNLLGKLKSREELINEQLKQMETAPTICVGAFILIVAFVTLWIIAHGSYIIRSSVLNCLLLSVPFLLVVWILGMINFRRSCLYDPAWKWVLFRYHIIGMALVIITIFIAPIFVFVSCSFVEQYILDDIIECGVLGVFLSVFIAIFVLGTWERRIIKKDMDRLQRKVAIRMINKKVRINSQKTFS
jgi:hypothetical protein